MKELINKEYFISIHRQVLLFDKKIVDDNTRLKDIIFKNFCLEINEIPIESDYANIKVICYKYYENEKKEFEFELKLDIYGDLILIY